MKRTVVSKALSLLLSLVLLLGLLPGTVLAASRDSTVYFTLSNAGVLPSGKDGVPMANVAVTLSGQDAYTMDDALTALHAQVYEKEAGYAVEEGRYGRSIAKLWGVEQSDCGGFGFYINGTMPMETVEEATVSDGDYLSAVIYRTDFSDQYAQFDSRTATVGTGTSVALTLTHQFYESTLQTAPLSGGTLTVNGAQTQTTTDGDGKAALSFDAAGTYIVSAVGPEGSNLIPPVCVVTVLDPVTVQVTAQDGYAFLYLRKEVTVPYGTAAAYGFSNGVSGCITALDALVAAHIEAYGNAFTPETAQNYLTVNSGNPAEMFGNDNTDKYSGFAINRGYPMDAQNSGYMVNTAPLSSGDLLDFFYYEDAYWGDYLVWFTDVRDKALNSISVEAGKPFTLKLRGFMFMAGYADPEPEPICEPDGALSIYSVDANGVPADSLADVTAATGTTFSFAEEGTYWISAMGFEKNGCPVLCPLLQVTVGEAGSGADNAVTALTLGSQTLTPAFDQDVFDYNTSAPLPYGKGSITANLTFPEGASASASYRNLSGEETVVTGFVSGKSKSLYQLAAGTTHIAFTLAPPPSSNALAKVYTLHESRSVALSDLTLTQGGRGVALNSAFSADGSAYTAVAVVGTALVLAPTVAGDAGNTVVTVNGNALAEGTASVAISEGENAITVLAKSADKTVEKLYTLTVTGVDSASCAFTVSPADAVLKLYDAAGNELLPWEGTSFNGLTKGLPYTYNVSKYGFTTSRSSILAGSDTDKAITLSPAAANTLPDLPAQWKNFRNSDTNMAITAATTPRSAAEASPKWVTKTSLNSSYYYPAPLLMVDGDLITTSGASLVKLSAADGSIKASGNMVAMNGLSGSAPLAYGEGMIFVPLSDGRVQAFQASTLDSLWVSESLGDQCTTPLIYADGYLYGSTGNSAPCKFFCLPVTDEVPANSGEVKYAAWMAYGSAHPNGSYWSAPLVFGDAVVYGTDVSAGGNASTGDSLLVSRNRHTGALISALALSGLGNQRSSIARSGTALYFTTGGGYLCSATLEESTGELSQLLTRKNAGVTSSTSTPVVYNGVVYYGANGRVIAADATTLATLREASFPSPFGVQASLLLSTAYSSDGTLYLYATQNANFGGIYVLCDDGVALTLSTLYTPEHTQYCNASIICDDDGTLYYRNDSGYLFAVGVQEANNCPVSLSVTPTDAVIALKDASATIVSPVTTGGTGRYDLPQGSYTYTVSRSGYVTQSDRFTVSATDASTHTPKNISVALLKDAPVIPTGKISVTFQLVGDSRHEESTVHTYRNDKGQLPVWISPVSLSVPAGSSAYDVFCSALADADLAYTANGGYVSGIQSPTEGNTLSEFDNGPASGWLYLVNGSSPSEGSTQYILSDGERIVFYYSDDYTQETGSEEWGEAPILPPLADTPFTFTDVAEDSWCYDAVAYVVKRGLFNGISDTTFSPAATMTRAMLATALYRLGGSPTVTGGAAFSDIPSDSWCADAVLWASARGITTGYSDGSFGQNTPITRQQLVTMLYRHPLSKGIDGTDSASLSGYTDAEQVADWAQDAMAWAIRAKLLNGTDATTLSPNASATRAQVATLLTRFCMAFAPEEKV